MNYGNAFAFATILMGTHLDDRSEALQKLTENLNLIDEAKADLYAQIEERVTADTKFNDAVLIIEQAMDNTRRKFG